MKVTIASDLHFEFQKDRGTSLVQEIGDSDVTLLCAGDLCTQDLLVESLTKLCKAFKNVVYTTGNHEYYCTKRDQVNRALWKASSKNPNLHVLNKSSVVLEGVTFHGATLWFREDPQALPYRRFMSDFEVIPNLSKWVYEDNEAAREYLQQKVQPGDVVMTHHLPSLRSVHPRYKNDPLNPFFVCDVEDTILKTQPKLWVHGHTHESCDYTLGETRVVCNPFGYVSEVNPNFNPTLRVELTPPHRSESPEQTP